MSPKVICCVVLTMFTDNIISILYMRRFILCLQQIFSHLSCLFLTVKSRIFAMKGSNSKGMFVLPPCSRLLRVNRNDLTQDCSRKHDLRSISRNQSTELTYYSLLFTELLFISIYLMWRHSIVYCNAAACQFSATVTLAYYVLCIMYIICKGIWQDFKAYLCKSMGIFKAF